MSSSSVQLRAIIPNLQHSLLAAEDDHQQKDQTSTKSTFLPIEPYDPDWWKKTVVYQILIHSFADSNGDGFGDLPGIISRLDYIRSLGVGAIWLSPFYESPQVDMGYDVSNFYRVDPLFGTDDDFAELVDEAHRRGIRVIMDLVPGHTSYKHEWFQKSRNRIEPYTDYYLWHAGDPNRPITVEHSSCTKEVRNGVPNNWVSVFGNSMWQWDELRGEYYQHQFAVEQPQLYYRNPLVRDEMRRIILFWLDKGIDGFRIDAPPHLFVQEPILNNDAQWRPDGPHDPGMPESFEHDKTEGRPEAFATLQEWFEMFQKYGKENHRDHIMVITEVYGRDVHHSLQYDTYNGKKCADFSLNHDLVMLKNGKNGYAISNIVNDWIDNVPKQINGWPNFVTGNHDKSRVASRFDNNANLVDGLNMLLLLLPGTPTTYYGEEIGMTNNDDITLEQCRDPNAKTPARIGTWRQWARDFCRTPMQWTGKLPHAGFSPDSDGIKVNSPWLPVNKNAAHGISVEAQVAEENENAQDLPVTHLGVYKKLVQLRSQKPFVLSRQMTPALITPTMYSFIRQDDQKSDSPSSSTYLIAIDVRQDGHQYEQYDFSEALQKANISGSELACGKVVVLSTATRSTSRMWPLAQQKDAVIDWNQISLLPGESFVAEFRLDQTNHNANGLLTMLKNNVNEVLAAFSDDSNR